MRMHPDRKNQPHLHAISPGPFAEPDRHYLDNNIPVFLFDSGEEEIMKLEFVFDAGQAAEDIPLTSSSVNMMLTEGSEKYTAEALNKTLDYYGTFLNLFAEKDTAGLSIMFLTKYMEKALELCNEILFRPVFPVKEFKALMNKRLQWYNVNREKVHVVASDKFFESIFGRSHPYGRQVLAEDFEKLELKTLREFHSLNYTHQGMTLFASGKIPGGTLSALNSFFGKQQSEPDGKKNKSSNTTGEKVKKTRILKKNAVQSAIRIGSSTINKLHPDYFGLKVLDTILGGYFGSRLMKNIREDKGFTYGIGSSVVSFRQSGYKVIGTEVGIENTEAALNEIYSEIDTLRNHPVGKEELNLVRNYMGGEMVRMFDGPFSIAESYRAAWEFGMDNSYYKRMSDKVKTIEPDEIIHLARTYYNPDDLYEIVAGPE